MPEPTRAGNYPDRLFRREGRIERIRWRVWSAVSKLPGVCPASAHSRIVMGVRDRPVRIDSMCTRDAADNGVCWCGKVTR